MKKFRITFHGLKMVKSLKDDKQRVVDEWWNVIDSDYRPAVWQFTDFTYLRSGLTIHHFQYDPSIPGRFVATQPENANGRYNRKGRHLAHYEVEIDCQKFSPLSTPVGTFGLKPTSN